MRAWQAKVELIGAGDEPVDLRRTLVSHGVAGLPPNEIDAEACDADHDAGAWPRCGDGARSARGRREPRA